MSRMRRWLLPAVFALTATTVVTPAAAAEQAPRCEPTGPSYGYVVLYQPNIPEFVAEHELRAQCGQKTAYYPEIGVAVATSADPGFASRIGVFRAYSAGKEIA